MTNELLDAFELDDFDDFEELDQAVDRIVSDLNVRKRPRSGTWKWILGGLAAAAAAGIWIGHQRPAVPDPEVVVSVSPPSAPVAVVETPVVEYGPSVPTEEPEPVAVVKLVPAPVEEPVEEPVEVLPSKAAGLRGDDAAFSIDGDRAVLASGLLHYRHDAEHEPGVRSIHVPELDLEFRPVGTVFTVSARSQVAAVRVDDGAVELLEGEHRLSTIRRGYEWVVIPDPEPGESLRVLDTTGETLRQVRQRIPRDCFCDPREVVAAVATLRLSEP